MPRPPSSSTLKSATKWFSVRMRASSAFSLERGMSTRRWPAVQAFRMRVSISATGSVMLMRGSPSPAGLAHAGDVPLQRELAETDPAEPELPEHRPHPSAALTAADPPRRELGGALGALDPARLRHPLGSLSCHRCRGLAPERPAEFPQQPHREVVAPGRGHQGDVHPVDLLDLVVIDLRENQLLLDPEGVVAPT